MNQLIIKETFCIISVQIFYKEYKEKQYVECQLIYKVKNIYLRTIIKRQDYKIVKKGNNKQSKGKIRQIIRQTYKSMEISQKRVVEQSKVQIKEINNQQYQQQYEYEEYNENNDQSVNSNRQNIETQLSRFFNSSSTQQSNIKSYNKSKGKYQTLPFSQSMFSPYIKSCKINQTSVKDSSKVKRNNKYLFNIVMFLWPYFRNKNKKFVIYVKKDEQNQKQIEKNTNSNNNTNQIIKWKRIIVDMSYFVNDLVEQLLFEDQLQTNQSLENMNTTQIKNMLKYSLSLDETPSSFETSKSNQNTTLLINRLFALPQIYISLTIQQSLQLKNNNRQALIIKKEQNAQQQQLREIDDQIDQVKIATQKYHRLNKQIKEGLIKGMIEMVIQQKKGNILRNQLNSSLFLSSSKYKPIIIYLLNKLIINSSSQDKQSLLNIWKQILFQFTDSSSSQINNAIRQFIVYNFQSLIKPYKFIEIIFYIWIQSKQLQMTSLNTLFNLTNSDEIKKFILDILRQNNNIKKQLYYIVQSSSPLSQLKIKPSLYKCFYQLLIQLDRCSNNLVNSEQFIDPLLQSITIEEENTHNQNIYQQNLTSFSQQSYLLQTLSTLSHWWSLNNDKMLPKKSRQFRYNLLAFIIQNLSTNNQSRQPSILDINNGTILAQISQGVQKRLLDTKCYQAAILVWSKLAQKLDFKIDEKMKRKANYFEDQKEIQTQKIVDKNNLEKQEQISKNNHNQKNKFLLQEKKHSTKKQKQKEYILSSQEQEQLPSISNNSKIVQLSSNSTTNQKLSQTNEYFQDDILSGPYDLQLKPPQTLYDCILALQNPIRRKVGYQQLLKLLSTRPDDIIFVWKQLIRQLMSPIEDQSTEALVKLMLIRPKQWIKDVGELFYSKKQVSMNQKATFVQILNQGISQLGQNPKKFLNNKQESQDQEFYFKRVASKYYVEKPSLQKKQPERTRRWGHTRIAHQNKSASGISSLMIVNQNQPYINQLYEVISELFFSIISRLCVELNNKLLKQPIIARHLIILLGTVASHIKNYFEKYLILEDISSICLACISSIETALTKQKKGQQAFQNEKKSQIFFGTTSNKTQLSPTKSLSPLVFSLIQTLNKLTLSIDQHLPGGIYESLKQSVKKLKKIDLYGIRPLIEMIEANIYKAIQTQTAII